MPQARLLRHLGGAGSLCGKHPSVTATHNRSEAAIGSASALVRSVISKAASSDAAD